MSSVEPNAGSLRESSERMGHGELVARVARTLPLEQAADAHLALEQDHPDGKIVLLPCATH